VGLLRLWLSGSILLLTVALRLVAAVHTVAHKLAAAVYNIVDCKAVRAAVVVRALHRADWQPVAADNNYRAVASPAVDRTLAVGTEGAPSVQRLGKRLTFFYFLFF
jgi:hypothetical protein